VIALSRFLRRWPLALAATLLSAAAAPSFYGTRFEHQPDAATLTELGRVLFFDRSLSASGRMACASCHDPAHAYGPPNALSAQKGGPHLDQMGLRPPPSLMYRAATPSFSEHYQESEGDDSIDNGPTGGFTWDGRAASVHDQAAIPLLAPNEMANASPAEVITRLARSPSAAPFQAAFGPHVLAQPELAWKGLCWRWRSSSSTRPPSRPTAASTTPSCAARCSSPAEQRGFEAFNDPRRGNCASCHISAIRRGVFPRFTDDGLIALGVPRNRSLPANADPAFFDLGLCGPLRTDLKDHPGYCGLFKTPRCAMWPPARPSSTTACTTGWTRRCASTPCGTPSRRSSTATPGAGPSACPTTCRRPISTT
jgi:cytochrome c peroxidase